MLSRYNATGWLQLCLVTDCQLGESMSLKFAVNWLKLDLVTLHSFEKKKLTQGV